MGFACPKEERDALVASEPEKLLLPRPSDMRYRWVCVRLDAIDVEELEELLVEAWRMCVPKSVAAAYDANDVRSRSTASSSTSSRLQKAKRTRERPASGSS